MAGLKVSRPDGTTLEIDKRTLSSMEPNQLKAIFSSLAPSPQIESEPNPEIIEPRSIEEIMKGGKRDKIALFLANNYTDTLILETAEIHRDWITIVAQDNYDLYLEKSHFNQYLTRLAKLKLVTKRKLLGKRLTWKLNSRIFEEYPKIGVAELPTLFANQ